LLRLAPRGERPTRTPEAPTHGTPGIGSN
jgi:hypothetical protein